MTDSAIISVRGRRVWDSRGRPTIEADVKLACGALGRAIAPAGASTGSGEALDLRDGGTRLGGYDVSRALASIEREIAPALAGRDALDQTLVDRTLIDLDGTRDKRRLGGNAIVAVSLASLHAAAASRGKPLWRYLGGEVATTLPLPEIQIYGGAHAAARVDIQDFMLVAPGARNFAQALEWTAEVYYAAGKRLAQAGRLRGVADEGGYWPDFRTNEQALEELMAAIADSGLAAGTDVAIALDIAATQLYREGRYHLALERRALDGEAFRRMLLAWLARYPIVSIEDPCAEDDAQGMAAFTAAAGDQVQIVGDDFLVTSAQRVADARRLRACNALLVKPNQAGTVSEALEALKAAREAGFGAIVSARSGESEDVSIAHLAVGWGVTQLKVGSFARSERMAKWNEALRIEEALGKQARFAGWTPYRRAPPAPAP